MRIVVILLFALAGTVSAAGTGDRSAFARLAYARSPDFLTTLDAASSKRSHRPRAEGGGTPGLRVLTVAAAKHLAGCAATLHSTERAASVQRAQLLAAKFIPAAEPSVREETGRPAEIKTFPSAALAPREGTVETVEPTTQPERAARSWTIDVIAAETLPSAELASDEKTLEMMDAPTPPPVEIAARGETVAVAEADTHAVGELALFPPAETISREVQTPEPVVARPAPTQAAPRAASSSQKSARAKLRRKSASRLAKRRRRVAQRRRPARVRRPQPVVTATYTDPRRGRIPASAEKMYDANWQKNAFTYD